ncbi:hypothetical protein [Streptomyces sp. IB2014 016-6]|uniref:hypothetical protein n=1 Tax=Streptomyces sp. IB2014 016-6 TaxID=2517818 RepID=UPI001650AED0|nr:hypothetical protein [Streptomyces sp. IB2014 016-6]
MHVSLPAVPEQIQVARRIVRKELAGLGWPSAKIAACEEIAVQLARHAIGVVGVSGYYLGVTKRPGPQDDAVAIRVSVTILDTPAESATVPAQGRPAESTGPAEPAGRVELDEDNSRLADVLTKRCGTKVSIVAQQGSWAASATLPAEVPCVGARP